MKHVIVAGNRDCTDYREICSVLNKYDWTDTELVEGGCRGVDLLAKRYAEEHGIPVKEFPADWDKYGKRAGAIRNKQMAEYATSEGKENCMLIAIMNHPSRGTKLMIDIARQTGIHTIVWSFAK